MKCSLILHFISKMLVFVGVKINPKKSKFSVFVVCYASVNYFLSYYEHAGPINPYFSR